MPPTEYEKATSMFAVVAQSGEVTVFVWLRIPLAKWNSYAPEQMLPTKKAIAFSLPVARFCSQYVHPNIFFLQWFLLEDQLFKKTHCSDAIPIINHAGGRVMDFTCYTS